MSEFIYMCRRWCLQLLKWTGAILMIFTNAHAATSFKLKPTQFYFSDTNTQSLITAAIAGDLPRAKKLVADGANPNDEGPLDNPYNRLRPLHYAIAANNKEAVKVLIAVGADPELSAQGLGRSFLFAMTLRNLEMLSLLLDLRPMDTLSLKTIELMLFSAVRRDRPKCLELFLDRGAPIDLPDGAHSTIMMTAIDCQDYELAEWLLLRGASLDVVAGGGVTPAYTVQFHLNKFEPGSPTYNKVLRLKELMEERGAVFPAATPAEVQARRGKR